MGDSPICEGFPDFRNSNLLDGASPPCENLKKTNGVEITLDLDDVEKPSGIDDHGTNEIDYEIQHSEDRWEGCMCGRRISCERECIAAKQMKKKEDFIKKIREMNKKKKLWLEIMVEKLKAGESVPLGMPKYKAFN